MTDLYLSKIALDAGCAYIPIGMNDQPLYVFSINELTKFAELYRERYNLKEDYDKKGVINACFGS
jgi:hypothetical protein